MLRLPRHARGLRSCVLGSYFMRGATQLSFRKFGMFAWQVTARMAVLFKVQMEYIFVLKRA
jgi:hypothetical protein